MNLFKRFIVLISLLIMTVGVLFFSALVVIRFYFAPRIDLWRAQFEALAQEQLGVPIQFDSLVCEFKGFEPIVRLNHIQSIGTNTRGVEHLEIASLSFGIRWWHLWGNMSDAVSEIMLQDANLKWQTPQPFDELSRLEVKHMHFQYKRQNYQYAVAAEQLALTSSLIVKPEVSLSHLSAYGAWNEQDKRLIVTQASIQDRKLAITFQGSWQDRPGKSVGISDFKGHLQHLELAELYTFLPRTLSSDAISWLSHAFIQGSVEEASFVLQGDLNAFPFGATRESGYFEVYGKLKNILLNYHQVKKGKQWLPIKSDSGEIAFIRDTIKVAMKKGQIWQLDKLINLSHVNALISGLENNTQVKVSTNAHASASDWLRFIRSTPLSQLSQDFFENAQAKGEWPVYLSLELPITDLDEVKLYGSVDLNGSSLLIDHGWPWLQKLTGVVEFTQTDVKLNQLKGDFYDSSISLNGSILKGLDIYSNLKMSSLQKYLPMPLWKRFSGQTPVKASLAILKNGFSLQAQSDLKGVAFNLPDGIRKLKNQTMPLRFKWEPQADRGSRLSLNLAKWLSLKLDRHVTNDAKARYFYRGSLAVQTQASMMPAAGLRIDAHLSQTTVQDWLDFVDEFQSSDTAAFQDRPEIMPELKHIRLETDHLYYLRHDLGAQKVQASLENQTWLFDLDGERAKGRITLGDHRLDANLERLALYPMDSNNATSQDQQLALQLSAVPTLNGSVKQFLWKQTDLGSLNIETERLPMSYYVKKLEFTHPDSHIELSGDFVQTSQGIDFSGIYRFDFENLAYYEKWFQLSKSYVTGGKGFLSGRFQWQNILQFDIHDLIMTIEGELKKGRFLHVDSLGLKFLNFIALQSITKLNRLGTSLKDTRQGDLGFDQIVIKADIKNAVLHLESLLLGSPILILHARGESQLLTQQLDLYTLVTPKVELSGVALATTVINPIVGAGALLSQWVFKDAIANSLSAYYHVTGTWDEPKVEEENPTLPTKATSTKE